MLTCHYACSISWIYVCRDTEYANLATQLDIFDEEFVEDEEVLAGEGGIDISDHKNVFRAVCTKVITTDVWHPIASSFFGSKKFSKFVDLCVICPTM